LHQFLPYIAFLGICWRRLLWWYANAI